MLAYKHMRIQNINLNYTNNRNIKKKTISFKDHPDFIRLKYQYDITASSFFRRGPYYGTPSADFQNLINIFNDIFSVPMQKPKKMLIVGIGESQEPFSYLAVIKDIIKDKTLEEVLDLSIVDLQSKPNKEKLFRNSFFDNNREPEFARDSFVKEKSLCSHPRFRVKNKIFNYLESTYNDSKKSQWETRIQDSIQECRQTFDIISINNTFGYICDSERIVTIKNVDRILEKGGLFITDPHIEHLKKASLSDKYEELYDGIFRKKV